MVEKSCRFLYLSFDTIHQNTSVRIGTVRLSALRDLGKYPWALQ